MAELSKIKMEYPLMEDMAKTFQQGGQQLKDTMSEMMNLANTLDDGALLGQGGKAFSGAIRDKLCPAISRLEKKFEELQKDITGAMRDMKEADSQSRGMFS